MPTIKGQGCWSETNINTQIQKLNHIHHAPLIVQLLGLTIPCPMKIYTIYHSNDGMTIIAKLPKLWSAVIKNQSFQKP